MNKLIAYFLAISLVLGGATFWYNKHIDSVVSSAKTELVNEYNSKLIDLQNKVDLKSIELNTKIKVIEDDKNIEINSLGKHYESIISGLQQRAKRPTSQSSNNTDTATKESTTGAYPAELFREDAEAFANFGKDAEQLRIELLSCYKQYDDVKEANDKLSTVN